MFRITALLFIFPFIVCDIPMPGGWFPQETTSAEAKERVHRALADRNAKTNKRFYDMLIKITEGKSQVVNGMNFDYKVYIGQSTCSKKDVKPEEVHTKCQLNNSNSAQKCTVKLYEQPWTNTFTVNEFSCKPASRTEALKA